MTLAGDEKMPLPMIRPTTNDRPLRYVKLLCLSKLCAPLSKFGVLGVPNDVYPGPEDESGNRELLKSKAEDTEYDRPPLVGRLGDGSLKESLREEGIPEEEDSSDSRPSLDEARLASSSESRGGRSCVGVCVICGA